MVRPKGVTIDEAVKDLPHTFCDIPTCDQKAELVVEYGDIWLYFCRNHNPNKMKIVYPKSMKKS
jgi:hypothetical protein